MQLGLSNGKAKKYLPLIKTNCRERALEGADGRAQIKEAAPEEAVWKGAENVWIIQALSTEQDNLRWPGTEFAAWSM